MGRARTGEQGAILGEVLARVRSRAPQGVVVFDLDSTVLDNRPRQARILSDYGRAEGLGALEAAHPERLRGWDPAANLRTLGLPEAAVARHLEPFRRFWANRFFTSAYCRYDVPVAGAPGFVREVVLAGGQVAYVTGRPAEMVDGTLDAFRRAELPLPDARRIFLLMKPSTDLADAAWKDAARGEVERLGPVLAAFDNEPAHVNAYARAWPDALAVHLDTDHSPRAEPVLARVPSIADFSW
jgi:phosphoglycolate phosphatase-like HAD superfamily hydrolase